MTGFCVHVEPFVSIKGDGFRQRGLCYREQEIFSDKGTFPLIHGLQCLEFCMLRAPRTIVTCLLLLLLSQFYLALFPDILSPLATIPVFSDKTFHVPHFLNICAYISMS